MLVNSDKLPPIRIEMKKFYDVSPSQNVFNACALINDKIKENQYEYNTDGFIFTPKNLGVGLTPTDNKLNHISIHGNIHLNGSRQNLILLIS